MGLDRLQRLQARETISQADIHHELYMLGCDKSTLERVADEAVENLFQAKLGIQEINRFISKVQSYCEHEEEKTGTSPNGSFTVNYFRCKKCKKIWNDD